FIRVVAVDAGHGIAGKDDVHAAGKRPPKNFYVLSVSRRHVCNLVLRVVARGRHLALASRIVNRDVQTGTEVDTRRGHPLEYGSVLDTIAMLDGAAAGRDDILDGRLGYGMDHRSQAHGGRLAADERQLSR